MGWHLFLTLKMVTWMKICILFSETYLSATNLDRLHGKKWIAFKDVFVTKWFKLKGFPHSNNVTDGIVTMLQLRGD